MTRVMLQCSIKSIHIIRKLIIVIMHENVGVNSTKKKQKKKQKTFSPQFHSEIDKHFIKHDLINK